MLYESNKKVTNFKVLGNYREVQKIKKQDPKILEVDDSNTGPQKASVVLAVFSIIFLLSSAMTYLVWQYWKEMRLKSFEQAVGIEDVEKDKYNIKHLTAPASPNDAMPDRNSISALL